MRTLTPLVWEVKEGRSNSDSSAADFTQPENQRSGFRQFRLDSIFVPLELEQDHDRPSPLAVSRFCSLLGITTSSCRQSQVQVGLCFGIAKIEASQPTWMAPASRSVLRVAATSDFDLEELGLNDQCCSVVIQLVILTLKENTLQTCKET